MMQLEITFPRLEICETLQYSQFVFFLLMSLSVICFLTQVVQTIEDHHQEVIALFRENGFHGLVAYDSDYALCNIPYYFSAHALKLSRNGKSLTTSQYLMHEVAKQLNLNPNRFVIFASLLGRFVGLPSKFHYNMTPTLTLMHVLSLIVNVFPKTKWFVFIIFIPSNLIKSCITFVQSLGSSLFF